MAITWTNISTYVDTNKQELLTKALYEFESLKYFTPVANCKTAPVQLPILDEEIFFQDGTSCGFTHSGNTTISARLLYPSLVKVQKSYCNKDFTDKWLNYEVYASVNKSALPLEQKFANDNVSKINEKLEIAVWQGDTDSTDTDLKQFDGLLKIINSVSGQTNNVTGATFTTSNAYDIIKAIVAKTPIKVKKATDSFMFMGWDYLEIAAQALVAANLYQYKTEDIEAGIISIPGTKLKMVALSGLDATKRIVVAQISNLFYGFDATGDNEDYSFGFETYDKTYRFDVQWISGLQIAFPDMITVAKITA